MREWYVVRTKPHLERQVRGVLSMREIECYLPEVPGKKTMGGERRKEPLFPCYLFAQLDLVSADGQDWLHARSAPGVTYFLPRGGEPLPIPEPLVDHLRTRLAQQARRPGRPILLRPGDRVLITAGPFSGLEAVFQGTLSGSGRSRVLISVLNRCWAAQIDADLLRRVG